MKNRRYILSIILLSTLAMVPTLVQAQPGPGGGGPHGMGNLGMLHHFLRMSDALELTDAQIDQIQTILDAAQPEIEGLADLMRQGRETWMAGHEPTDFDEAEAKAFAEEQSSLHAELMVLGMKTRAQVMSVLTSEQLEKLDELRAEHGGKRGKRHDRRNF